MIRKDAARFVIKAALLLCPLAGLVVAYVAWDPFLVLRQHNDFYPGSVGVSPNRDYVSTEVLISRGPTNRYDSFVFGNSRSSAFETRTWSRHLQEGSRPFHYDASLESLYGIWAKVRYLDRNGYSIRNVLMVVDADLLRHGTNVESRALYRKHPVLSENGSKAGWWAFHLSSFEAFLSRQFFVKYGDHRLFGRWRPYMAGVLERRSMTHDPETNDLMFTPVETEIAASVDDYYRRHDAEFIDRGPPAGTPSPAAIGSVERERLVDIGRVFQRQGARAQVVISPLFDRRALSLEDRKVLEDIFGPARIHDYSGTNDITVNRFNYYEASHYRIAVANRIMDGVYGSAPVVPHQ